MHSREYLRDIYVSEVNTNGFKYIDFTKIIGGANVAVKRVLSAPGVYGFLRKISLNEGKEADQFVDDIVRYVEQTAANRHSAKMGPLHSVSLDGSSRISEHKLSQLKQLSKKQSFRKYLASVLEAASVD